MEFDPTFSTRQRTVDGDELLLQQTHLVGVVPAQLNDHAGVVAVLVVGPGILADLLRPAALLPEIDAADGMMAPPEGPMVVVVRRGGMAHAGERSAGRPHQRIEERPGITRAEVPAQAFLPLDLEGNLVVRLRNDLDARHDVGHGGTRREGGRRVPDDCSDADCQRRWA